MVRHSTRLTRTGAVALMAFALAAGFAEAQNTATSPEVPHSSSPVVSASAEQLNEYVRERVGDPRVITVCPGIVVAVGYDLANVTVVQTETGNVVIDTGSCTPQALRIKEALESYAAGGVQAVIYTHGDIEQTGGGGAWATDPKIPIWGTAGLADEFYKQFILLQPSELRRGIRQFGLFLPDDARSPSAWGRLPDISQLGGVPDIRMPNQTITGETSFTVGGIEFQLFPAPGATPDHLFVWIPQKKTLIVGDNFISGFPALSGVRGTPERNADQWIASLDKMRSLPAEHIISARHEPLTGEENIREALVAHRDVIQWLRDETMRAINRGESVGSLVAHIKLPDHLANSPYLAQVTGSVEWAVRTLYSNYAGWFDERAEMVRPVPPVTASQREIQMMGGAETVYKAALQAQQENDLGWSVHLLSKLQLVAAEDAEQVSPVTAEMIDGALADALDGMSKVSPESDLRGYLASMAAELRAPTPKLERWPCPADATICEIPLDVFFEMMALRLKTSKVDDLYQTVKLYISDEDKTFFLTIRNGIFEVVENQPLPGTPKPIAEITTTGVTWRKMCMGVANPTVEAMVGHVDVKGSKQAVRRFTNYFECSKDFKVARKKASESELTSTTTDEHRQVGGPDQAALP